MLLDRRVVLVTGKGGVGKTTVATALALGAAMGGKRVLLVETSGASRVPAIFGVPPRGYALTSVAPNLWTLSITPTEAIEEYAVRELHLRRLYKMVFQNRIMGPFVDAVPGLHDLIQLGKVFDLERDAESGRPRWDLIVVDAPATGHGLTMLASPRAMMELTVAGPFHDNARDVAKLFDDPQRTALVLVALAEEMPVNETLDLHRRLGAQGSLVQALVLNEVHPSPVPDLTAYEAQRASLLAGANVAGKAAVALIDGAILRLARQDRARTRLATLGRPVYDLPFLFRRDLGRAEFATLASALAAA